MSQRRPAKKIIYEVPENALELDNSLRLLAAAAAIIGPAKLGPKGELPWEYRKQLVQTASQLGEVASKLEYTQTKSEQANLDPYLECMVAAATGVIGPGGYNFNTQALDPRYLELLPHVASNLSALAAQNAGVLAKAFATSATHRVAWAQIHRVGPNFKNGTQEIANGKTHVVYVNRSTRSKYTPREWGIEGAEVARTPFPDKATNHCPIAQSLMQGHQYAQGNGLPHFAKLDICQVDIDPSKGGAGKGFQEIQGYEFKRWEDLPGFLREKILTDAGANPGAQGSPDYMNTTWPNLPDWLRSVVMSGGANPRR